MRHLRFWHFVWILNYASYSWVPERMCPHEPEVVSIIARTVRCFLFSGASVDITALNVSLLHRLFGLLGPNLVLSPTCLCSDFRLQRICFLHPTSCNLLRTKSAAKTSGVGNETNCGAAFALFNCSAARAVQQIGTAVPFCKLCRVKKWLSCHSAPWLALVYTRIDAS